MDRRSKKGWKWTHKSSIEFTDNNLESEVWLMAVPMVAWGGLVVPIVPEAVTWAWACGLVLSYVGVIE
jgi:hypothetical protein